MTDSRGTREPGSYRTSAPSGDRATPTLPWTRALAAVTIWGASFVAIRLALATFGPFGLVSTRLLLASLCLVLLQRVTQGGDLLPREGDRVRCALLGLVLGVHSLIQAFGLRYTSAINTGWIIAAIPAIIAVGAHVVLGQRLRLVGWGGVVVATVGVGIVTLASPPDLTQARLGDALQLLSCFTWAIYTLAAGGVVARNGALRVTTFVLGTAALLTLAGGLVSGEAWPTLSVESVAAVLYLALLSNGLAMLLWYQALDALGPARVGATLYLEPFSTLGAAWWLLAEPVGWVTLLGGLVVLLGVACVSRGARRRGGAADA